MSSRYESSVEATPKHCIRTMSYIRTPLHTVHPQHQRCKLTRSSYKQHSARTSTPQCQPRIHKKRSFQRSSLSSHTTLLLFIAYALHKRTKATGSQARTITLVSTSHTVCSSFRHSNTCVQYVVPNPLSFSRYSSRSPPRWRPSLSPPQPLHTLLLPSRPKSLLW
jgi:hypothetical protein